MQRVVMYLYRIGSERLKYVLKVLRHRKRWVAPPTPYPALALEYKCQFASRACLTRSNSLSRATSTKITRSYKETGEIFASPRRRAWTNCSVTSRTERSTADPNNQTSISAGPWSWTLQANVASDFDEVRHMFTKKGAYAQIQSSAGTWRSPCSSVLFRRAHDRTSAEEIVRFPFDRAHGLI
jgi:hypothetical protein